MVLHPVWFYHKLNLVLVFFFVPVLGIEASITKFLDAAKAVEADFLRKQMYSRVHHPREVTQDVRVAENLSFCVLLFHEWALPWDVFVRRPNPLCIAWFRIFSSGRGVLGSIFVGYLLLASENNFCNPNLVTVCSSISNSRKYSNNVLLKIPTDQNFLIPKILKIWDPSLVTHPCQCLALHDGTIFCV